MKEYRKKNRRYLSKCKNEYNQNNKDKVKKWKDIYYQKYKDKIKEKRKEYFKKNKGVVTKSINNWRKNNPGKILGYTQKYRTNNPEKTRKWAKLGKERHKDKYKIRMLTWKKYGRATWCWLCGSTKNVQHHHYTKPYELNKFVDICTKCHSKMGGDV